MTNCEDLQGILRALSDTYGWKCRPLPGLDGVMELMTGRAWPDSEPVRLRVRFDSPTTLVVSDGGELFSRLRSAGADMEDETFRALWKEAIETYRLHELDERLYVQVDASEAPYALNRLADALVALDALHLVLTPEAEREDSLADDVESWLRGVPGVHHVKARPSIEVRGLRVRPSLQVSTTRRQVLLQATATSNKTVGFNHAFTMFSLADRAAIPQEERLTVLGGTWSDWTPARLTVLSEVSYVGFWRHRDLLRSFFDDGNVPVDRLLVPAPDRKLWDL